MCYNYINGGAKYAAHWIYWTCINIKFIYGNSDVYEKRRKMRDYLITQFIKLIICLIAVYFMYNFYTEVFFDEGIIIKKDCETIYYKYYEFIISDGKREQHVTVDEKQYSTYEVGDMFKK